MAGTFAGAGSRQVDGDTGFLAQGVVHGAVRRHGQQGGPALGRDPGWHEDAQLNRADAGGPAGRPS